MSSVKIICEDCHKYQRQKPSKGCHFCARLIFPEDIICHLARNGGGKRVLSECDAFRPLLFLAYNNKPVEPEEITNRDHSDSSHRAKWLEAYGKQQVQSRPNQVHFNLRFHICLVTSGRNKIFSQPNQYVEKMVDIFSRIETSFEQTEIDILWLSEDHIHLHLNTSPNYSVDQIVNKTLSVSERKILSRFPELKNQYEKIWESAYFTETIG